MGYQEGVCAETGSCMSSLTTGMTGTNNYYIVVKSHK